MGVSGYIILVLAFLAALTAAFVFLFNARSKSADTGGKIGVYITSGLVTLAVVLLEIALVGHNFNLIYVADYSSRTMPLPYLLTALWAGNAGSLLFWAWVLSICSTVLMWRWRGRAQELIPVTGAVSMAVLAFFVLLLIAKENPFAMQTVVPSDGTGLNPLLQNPAMIIHPPLLLGGYVVLTIPFAIGIAALATRKLDGEWLLKVRGWAVLAWVMLAAGNIIGMWWAYVELGWGGYWAWDPVENAGLMPWLILTAFLHSMHIQQKRHIFKGWTLALLIFAFFLTIFGTFLTRSDFASVHSFGTTDLEPFFIAALAIIFFGSYILLISRRKELKGESEIEEPLSREGTFFLTNLLLLLSTLAILFATVFELIFPAAVGKSFFNVFNTPIFMIIIALSGVCIVISWKKSTWRELGKSLVWPGLIFLLVLIVTLAVGVGIVAGLAYSAAAFGLSAAVMQLIRGLAKKNKADAGQIFPAARKNRWGAYIVHAGLAVMAIGIVGSSMFAAQKEATLTPGQTMKINGYMLVYDDMNFSGTQTEMTVAARVEVFRNDKPLALLVPEKGLNINFQGQQTKVAIRSTPLEDLYVILNSWQADKTAGFKVMINPLVIWVWIGGALIVLGGIICFWPLQEINQDASGKNRGQGQ